MQVQKDVISVSRGMPLWLYICDLPAISFTSTKHHEFQKFHCFSHFYALMFNLDYITRAWAHYKQVTKTTAEEKRKRNDHFHVEGCFYSLSLTSLAHKKMAFCELIHLTLNNQMRILNKI